MPRDGARTGWSGLDGGIGGSVDLGVDLADDLHEYAVTWSPDRIVWSLDGRDYADLGPADIPGGWPFGHGFFLVLNLAVGGGWPGNDTDDPALPATMLGLVERIEIV